MYMDYNNPIPQKLLPALVFEVYHLAGRCSDVLWSGTIHGYFLRVRAF